MKSNTKYKNVIIFTFFGIGDFVWATSAISLIRDYDKDIKITLVTLSKYKELIVSDLNINRVIIFNNKYFSCKNIIIRFLYKFYFLNITFFKLYKQDLAIFLDINTFFAKFCKKFYKIQNIIGTDIMCFGYNLKNEDVKYYSKIIEIQKDMDRLHCMMKYQQIIRSVFCTCNLSLPILPDTTYLFPRVKNVMGRTKKYTIALVTSGTVKWRYWDNNYFKDLIVKINNIADVTFFIVGNSLKEINNGNYLKDELKNVDIRNICGKTTLLELKELLKQMNLLISVDTGVIHLAATVNLPTISFHGQTLPTRSMPVNPNSVCLCSYRDCSPCDKESWYDSVYCKYPLCMYDITPKQVFEETRKILKI